MLKEYKNTLIVSSLVTLLPIPVGAVLGMGWSVVLPLIMLATQWFCIFWSVKDPGNRNQSKKPMKLILWTVPVLSCFTSFVSFALTKGLEFSVSMVYCLVFGVMFAAIGNYLPKVKMNSTMGIKVAWAYTSEENWKATHRFGGKVWFLCGIVLLGAAFLPLGWSVTVMIVDITVSCVLPIVYSWLYYRKQKKNGDALRPLVTMPARYWKTSVVFLGALGVFVCVMLFTGDIEYRLEEDRFTVEASYHEDLTLPYDVVESIGYREGNVSGIRVWGFGSLRLLMGTFQNEEFGSYTRYTYYDPGCAVVLTTMKETYVLSGRDRAETKALYAALSEKIG